jgi:hypothetical protein
MNHDELVAALERERISYPDDLPGERYARDSLPLVRTERARPYEPITPKQAAANFAALKQFADREGDHE